MFHIFFNLWKKGCCKWIICIPYEIDGEQDENNIDCYMLLSPSANRAKSWTCEHCPNWTSKDVEVCKNCFWSHPENYTHIAGKDERKIVVTFTNNEIDDYESVDKSRWC